MIIFPFAGGSSSSLRDLAVWLEEPMELVYVDYPGHLLRSEETLLESVPELAFDSWRRIGGRLRAGYLVLGMSLGALVALEFVKVGKSFGKAAEGIVAISSVPPGRISMQGHFSHLPESEFVGELCARYPGDFSTMATDPVVREHLLPILRADITAFESYGQRPLELVDVPCLAVGGTDDRSVSYWDLLAWGSCTTGQCVTRRVSGGHFLLEESGSQVAGEILEWAQSLDR
ncbi:thioesterase II family protein [Nesterenkonia alkaliphila]|uniref:thioesterase II family protein n=1 Tax=Nesterenkonia alkaliphila TaxID=1463631 RepID=UPI00227ACCAC|nr:alpha/beta fold hydrolase [Nesterenkonia alkaliphila]